MSVSQSVGRLQLIAFSRLHRVVPFAHGFMQSFAPLYVVFVVVVVFSIFILVCFGISSWFVAAALAAVIKNPSMWGPDALLAAVIKIYMTPTAARRYT